MPTEAISKLEPHWTIYLHGFDRRGAAAALHSTSSSGFTCSGLFSDQVDFAVVVLLDTDDAYGHLTRTRYLPNFDMTGVVLDVDIALTNCFSPTSVKIRFDRCGAARIYHGHGFRRGGVRFPCAVHDADNRRFLASLAISIGGPPAGTYVFKPLDSTADRWTSARCSRRNINPKQ